MYSIADLAIVSFSGGKVSTSESGRTKVLCSPELCNAPNLTVVHHTLLSQHDSHVGGDSDYHLVYVVRGSDDAVIQYGESSLAAVEGSGAMVAPGEQAHIRAGSDSLAFLELAVPIPPVQIEDGLPGDPGYLFNRESLRVLSDASGGRVRRFCAESSIRRADGSRLTLTNAFQAGEMHYNSGGSSPYHLHEGTTANPEGAAHCYVILNGEGRVEVAESTQDLEAGTLVYFPPGVPHRLRALNGELDYFEIQAWRSFKTTVLSEESLGLKWYYDPLTRGAEPQVWDQS